MVAQRDPDEGHPQQLELQPCRGAGDAGNDTIFARDGVRDDVHGGSGTHDRAQVDDPEDQVNGVETTF